MLLWYLIVALAVALNIAAWGGLTYAIVQIVRGKTKKPGGHRRPVHALTTASYRRQRAVSFG